MSQPKALIFPVYRRGNEPTEAQKRAGNYLKRKMPWQGLTIAVENEIGSVRSGVGPDGTPWQTRMLYPYGYFLGTEGVDGDQVDVYVGPWPDTATMVYVIHQRQAGNFRRYDEDKCFIGFNSAEDARAAFAAHYDDARFFGSMTAMPVAEFVSKVKATKGAPKMIKAMLFVKAHVPGHLRHLRGGRVVIVHPYENRRHARDKMTGDLFARPAAPAGGEPARKGEGGGYLTESQVRARARQGETTIDAETAEESDLRRIMEEDTRKLGGGSTGGHAIRQDAQGVIVGALTNFDWVTHRGGPEFEEVYDAFAPTRARLRDLFGDKVTLYRADETNPDRIIPGKPTLYFGSRELAEKFAQNGRTVAAFEVPIEDILAAPSFPNGYWEFIVRNPAVRNPLLRADRETYERALWDEMNRRWDAGDDVYFNTMTRQTRVTPKTREAMRFRNGRLELYQGRRGDKERWISVGPSGQVIDSLAANLGMPTSFQRGMAEPPRPEPEEEPERMTDSQAQFQVARLLDMLGPGEDKAASALTPESLQEVLAAWKEDDPNDTLFEDALKRLRPDLFGAPMAKAILFVRS